MRPEELELLFQVDEAEEALTAMEEDRLHGKQASLQGPRLILLTAKLFTEIMTIISSRKPEDGRAH